MFGNYRLPVLSTVPRSGTWFLRYVFSFVCHLDQGGRLDDLLTGEIVGNPQGPAFDFERFRGGPLFRVAGTLPDDHLFIGHTVCPGFANRTDQPDWWKQGSFHVRGYDALHEEESYRNTPVDLATYDFAPIKVPRWTARPERGAALQSRSSIETPSTRLRRTSATVRRT